MKGVPNELKENWGVKAPAYGTIAKKVKNLENEVNRLKDIILFRSEPLAKPTLVSFRGMAKSLVSVDELEKAIEGAKSAIFKR